MAINLGGFLGSLPPHEAEWILVDARRRRFQRSDIVFHEGDAGDTIHVVTSGRFGVQTGTADGDRVMLQIVATGEVFGELSVFGTDRRRTATVVTLEAGETHSINAEAVRELCSRAPEAASYFLGLLAERSIGHTTRLLEIVFVPAEIRVVRRMVELASAFPDGITLTQEQVGEMACTSRATVNKVVAGGVGARRARNLAGHGRDRRHRAAAGARIPRVGTAEGPGLSKEPGGLA